MIRICVCGGTIPGTIVVDGTRRNLANRRKCLQCVPFGMSIYRKKATGDKRSANAENMRRYYQDFKTKHGKDHITLRKERRKPIIIKLLGGGCQVCGYNKCLHALTFHHMGNKSFDIQTKGFRNSLVVLKNELMKCVLLCHNCHTEHHAGQISVESLHELHELVKLKIASLPDRWTEIDPPWPV